MAFRVGADEGVAVRQALAAGADVAEEAVTIGGPVAPDDLLRDLTGLVVCVVVVGLAATRAGETAIRRWPGPPRM